MPTAPSRGTANRILDVAERLVQLRGYNAFSYADVAKAVGIRKASLHYHFATKGDLGLALVEDLAAHLGGRADVRSAPGEGTVVELEVPA